MKDMNSQLPPISSEPLPARKPFLRRFLPLIALVGGVALAAYAGGEWWGRTFDWIREAGTAGMAVFLAAMVALTSFCFPVSAFGFSAGMLYGPWVGLGLMFVGGICAGSLMFFLGRFALRAHIHDWSLRNPRLAAFDRLAADRAIRINFLARLSPINYGVVCYSLAAGRSTFRQYLIGMLAILPSMGTQVWAGHLAATAGESLRTGESRDPLEWGLLALGLLFFLVLSWQVGRMMWQAWAEGGNMVPSDRPDDGDGSVSRSGEDPPLPPPPGGA
jgi:uncharacterized membrane protein YdjX (TVP38/TMEM64 family)